MKLKKGALSLITASLRKIAQDGMSDGIEEEVIRNVAENIEHKPAFDEGALRALVGDNFDEVVKLIGGQSTAGDAEPIPAPVPVATDTDPVPPQKDDDPRTTAMDADSIAAAVGAKIESKYAARDAVEGMVGRIACDSFPDAAAIYAYALKQKGIACDGINEAGLKAMVAICRDAKPEQRQIAADSAPSTLTERFKQG